MTGRSPSFPARFVVTGPTGWIGSALLALLHRAGDPDALAAGESLALFGSRAGVFSVPGGPELPVRSLADISADDVADAHLIHLAYLTKDKLGELSAEEFVGGNTAIDDAVCGAANSGHPASIFIASSGAARQAENGIDVNPYGIAKLEQEARFLAFGRSSGVAVLCGRIFNLAGPYINKLEDYAISNFALQAFSGEPIRIQANKLLFRSFLHVEDLCRMIIRAARERIGEERPIDLCGMELLEIQDMAERVATEVGIGTKIERPVVDFAGMSEYVGQPVDSRALAARVNLSLRGFEEQLRDTIDWMRALPVQSAAVTQVRTVSGGFRFSKRTNGEVN